MIPLAKSNGSLFPAIPTLFDDIINKDWLDSSLTAWAALPVANVRETNEAFVIEVAAPGMRRDDFKVELQDNVLSISADVHESYSKADNNYARREFSYQSFHRRFKLADDIVERSKVSARFNNGILFITVAKRENAKAKPSKVIAVS
ncbi:MAG TPA: Hsp20/alpha crystallin family protein [Chryseolinea sp.]